MSLEIKEHNKSKRVKIIKLPPKTVCHTQITHLKNLNSIFKLKLNEII